MPSQADPAPDAGAPPPGQDGLRWEVEIPLLNNPLVLRPLGLALGLPLVLLYLVIALAAGPSRPAAFFLLTLPLVLLGIGAFFALVAVLVCGLLLGNRYDAVFVLDGEGAHYFSGRRSGRTGQAAAMALLAAGRPGQAALLRSSLVKHLAWPQVARVRLHPGRRVISLYNSWRPVIHLYCPSPQLFQQAQAAIAGYRGRPAEN